MATTQARGRALLNRIKGVTSDALSFPVRAYYGAKGANADKKRALLKRARAWDDAPNVDEKGMPTDAYKDRFMANEVRKQYKK